MTLKCSDGAERRFDYTPEAVRDVKEELVPGSLVLVKYGVMQDGGEDDGTVTARGRHGHRLAGRDAASGARRSSWRR